LKLVQGRSGNKLEAIEIGNDFLGRTQVAQQLRERMDMKLKSFCTKKEMVSTEWEKVFASYIFDKGLITRIYRELKKLNSPKINDSTKKWDLFKGRNPNG
jgi:hypothetical protein